jgi:hypothetical protein
MIVQFRTTLPQTEIFSINQGLMKTVDIGKIPPVSKL